MSKLLYDYIAGWEKSDVDSLVVKAGRLPIFRNDNGTGGWLNNPNTILVDSKQLESGQGMSEEFKKLAARQIEDFKNEYNRRFPGRKSDSLTDEDLLREIMNTVGKLGKLGENVKCVVSVSMLTEGWDANTVTHVLGVRAFTTQLLCEQVIGRALRRISYHLNSKGLFEPEYAEIYGVPFSFIPCSGSVNDPSPGLTPTHVRALENRISCEITFPRLTGYRFDINDDKLEALFTEDSNMILDTINIPTEVENAPIVGESIIHTLDDLKNRRLNEISFYIAKLVLDSYFKAKDNAERPWFFPNILKITKKWLKTCLFCCDNAYPQLLLLSSFAHEAAKKIYESIVVTHSHKKLLCPILTTYDTIGSTKYIDFDTIKPVYLTKENKCHISHVVADTNSWEQKLAQTLENENILPEVVRYVKNYKLGFNIPYSFEGENRNYQPDFIVCLNYGHGLNDLLNLIVEVSGASRKDKEAKTKTAKTLWIPAVNNIGLFGRWAFIEIKNPWNAANNIRQFIEEHRHGQQ